MRFNKNHLAALRALIDYNWDDELEDYQDNCGDGPNDNQRDGHIFETLVLLTNKLTGANESPRDYIEEDEEEMEVSASV